MVRAALSSYGVEKRAEGSIAVCSIGHRHLSFRRGRPLVWPHHRVVLLGSMLTTHSIFVCLRRPLGGGGGGSFGYPVWFGTRL